MKIVDVNIILKDGKKQTVRTVNFDNATNDDIKFKALEMFKKAFTYPISIISRIEIVKIHDVA